MTTHVMQITASYPNGANEWTCPICGRTFLLQMSPYKKIVLVPGDEQAVHSGGTGGLSVSSAEAYEHDHYLDVFESWMSEQD